MILHGSLSFLALFLGFRNFAEVSILRNPLVTLKNTAFIKNPDHEFDHKSSANALTVAFWHPLSDVHSGLA